MNVVYVDNNATTQVAPEVLAALQPFLGECYFNPSSMYDAASAPAEAIKHARGAIARALGAAHADEILFTSCATESNNQAIFGAMRANPARRHVITTAVEHPAVINVALELERQGMEVTWLGVDGEGRLDLREVVRALRPDTLLISVMHANNETGVVFPVAEVARLAKETDPGILVHTDATQTIGKLAINLEGEFRHVDLLSFSGHKLHAPKGVGGLFLRRGTPCRPLLLGGHQEGGRRGGTENVAFIVALGVAVEMAVARHREDEPRIRAMRNRLESELLDRIPLVQINGAGAERLVNTLNVSCHFIEGEGMLFQLSSHGICASSGSACTSGSLEPSHVMKAMGVPFTAAHGSVRFSLSRYNTESDIDRIVEVFPDIVAALRRLSPYWDVSTNGPRPEAASLMDQTR